MIQILYLDICSMLLSWQVPDTNNSGQLFRNELFQKKEHTSRGELRTYFSEETSVVFLDFFLYPWIFQAKQISIHENFML